MLYSLAWLRQFTPVPDLSDRELSDAITTHVAEVEGVRDLRPKFSGVVVGRILEVSRHPNADKLQCTVTTTDGENRLRIVCGARNIAVGQVVPVALPGAQVLDRKTGAPFTIRDSEIRGEPSQGMLCSADELGIPAREDGIHQLDPSATLGYPLEDVLGMGSDRLIDIENKSLTHRPDLWGHWGMARELSVLLQTPLTLPKAALPKAATGIPVEVGPATELRRYVALLITGVEATPSPPWLSQRLEQLGVRSVNAIVDVTNLVMLETGQPLHAFDAEQVRELHVRLAAPGESFTTFDGTTLALSPEDVVIAGADGALALGGVVGGPHSGVRASTTSIVLEAASFDPVRTRRTAARHGARTDAAVRFEKDVDPTLAPLAAARALEYLTQLFPGVQLAGRTEVELAPRAPQKVGTTLGALQAILGLPLERSEVTRILTGLGCTVRGRADQLEVLVPTHRGGRDLTTPADLAEEVIRFVGYDQLPTVTLAMPVTVLPPPEARRATLLRELPQACALALGATEVLTDPFVSEAQLRRFSLDPSHHRRLVNPQVADLAYLRSTLAIGLSLVAQENVRTSESVRVFELGQVVQGIEGELTADLEGTSYLPAQPQRLGILESSGEGSFGTLRALLEQLCATLRLPAPRFEAERAPAAHLHPGRSARVLVGETLLGTAGELHPALRLDLDLPRTAIAELDVDAILACALAEAPRIEPPPAFPPSLKDVSVAVDEAVEVATLVAAVRAAEVPQLLAVEATDVFRGGSLPPGQKSVTLRLTLRAPDHTLEEREILAAVKAASKALTKLGGEIR